MAHPLGASDDLDVALLSLHRLTLSATIHAGQSLDPTLTATQIRVLTLLTESAGGLTLTAIAEALSMSSPSASRLCQRLVRDGLVHRAAGPGHYIIMSLSGEGRRVLRKVNRARLKPLRRLVERLPEPQRAAMVEQLAELGRLAREHHDLW
jgi:DNA-binding MarR family transcriptional regulator